MNINYTPTIKQEEFNNEFKSNNEGHFNEYLYDTNLTVPAMIKKVLIKIYYNYYYLNLFYLV
jgi:hypothetical protein